MGQKSRGMETRITKVFTRVSPTESLILFVFVFALVCTRNGREIVFVLQEGSVKHST